MEKAEERYDRGLTAWDSEHTGASRPPPVIKSKSVSKCLIYTYIYISIDVDH